MRISKKKKVLMVGNLPQLGNWDVTKGVPMTTHPDEYPISRGSVCLPAKTAFEYKYVVIAEGGAATPAAPAAARSLPPVKQQWEAINRHTHTHTYTHTHTNTCTCACICVHVRVRVYMCVCARLCVRALLCVCVCVCE